MSQVFREKKKVKLSKCEKNCVRTIRKRPKNSGKVTEFKNWQKSLLMTWQHWGRGWDARQFCICGTWTSVRAALARLGSQNNILADFGLSKKRAGDPGKKSAQ
jgi:hypothetical protein